jgi:2-deoxystreptamine N-acetyl-D-glucosaminyltransferase/2-deoxystreptamine glucosyltransferase
LRILRLTPWYYHDQVDAWPAEYDSIGGMQIQTTRLSRMLAEDGVQQVVVTVGFPGLPPVREDREGLTVRIARMPIPEIRSESTGLVGLTPAWFFATLGACFGLRRWKPDLVHVHADGALWTLLLAPVAARLVRAPYVLTLHCSRLAGYVPRSAMAWLQQRFGAIAEKRAIRRAARVVTLTESTARVAAKALGVSEQHFAVVPDIVDTGPAPPRVSRAGAGDFGAWASAAGHRPIIGFVGRLASEKGWQYLVPLALRLRDLHPLFLIVGDGSQRERLEEQIRAEGLADEFLITGFVPNNRVPEALAVMTTLVMPSSYEELGGVALEALAVGTPMAAFAVGGLRTTVGRLCPDMLVPAGDLDALATKVRRIIAEPDRYAALARSAGPAVEQTYGAPAALRQITAVYEAVLPRLAENPR